MKKYSRIFRYLTHDKGQIALYTTTTFLSVFFNIVSLGMLIPFFNLIFGVEGEKLKRSTSPLINKIQDGMQGLVDTQGKERALLFICLFIIVFTLLKNLFLVLSNYILNPLKNRIVIRMRNEMYDKILQLPIGYFTEKRKGDLISRITNDIGEVEGSLVGALEGWVRDPITIVIVLAALLLTSWQLTVFVLVCLPVVGFLIGKASRSLKSQSSLVANLHADAVSILDETLGGLRVVKAFNLEALMRTRFFANGATLLRSKNRVARRRDLASPLSETLGITVFCGILYFGGRLVLSGGIPLMASAFIMYLGLFYNIINPAKSLATSFSNMQKGQAAIGRIEEVLQTPNTVDDNETGTSMATFSHAIELRNVSFDYDGIPILKNINLTIPKGSTVALVGSSGAGKSTLADLIPRFHDVTGGELLIDGVNIRSYALRSVREQISIVTQEPILFNDTIENNIRMGKQDATEEEISYAARIANAHAFIVKKEAGFQTNIGDRGTKLSGGERQRLTIARAIVKNPPILILDEATSSLDTESERLVQDAINNMMQNRTSIVIAHRLSTIRHADEIIVLQKGEIVERGSHDSLMAKGGYYHKLVQMQEVR
ncbi:MAG: antibiotic transporter ATP-binding protein [Flaviaesturariibacter sp.]|nr:antibiotic transporter ATP-binding protein [Flaviaesturariibacter sp.]